MADGRIEADPASGRRGAAGARPARRGPRIAASSDSAIVARLRAAGCVDAEAEAAILIDVAGDAGELDELVRRREAGELLEHLAGWVRFGGLRLSIGPGVFVPRRRSRLLARAARDLAAGQPRPVVLEAYCGVAPIAATVAAAVPGAEIHAADIDPVALEHARRNLPASATIHRSDGLDGLPSALHGRCSLIAAVPPYVPAGEARLLPRDTLEREPERALLGGTDGLDATRRLIDEAGVWLAPGGVLLSELHRTQYAAAAAHAERLGFRAGRRDGRDGQTVLLELRA